MGVKVANNATSTIVGAVSSSDVGITVTAGTGALFPALGAGDYFYATLVSAGGTREIVKVTARATDAMTIVRGQEGTTAQSFAAGSRLELRVTAASITDMIAEHDQASEITFVPTGGIAATNVQSAIAELDSEAAKSAALAASGGAALIGFAPTGGIAATNVQSAVMEVVTDLAASGGANLVGFLSSGTGATARTVQSKLRDVVSVKDFGAVGDGITDDSAAFIAAIQSLKSRVAVFTRNGDGQAELYVPEGAYRINQSGVLSNINATTRGGYKMRGAGRNNTVIWLDCTDGATKWLYDNGATIRNWGLTFEGITFAGGNDWHKADASNINYAFANINTFANGFKITGPNWESSHHFIDCEFRYFQQTVQWEGTNNADGTMFTACNFFRTNNMFAINNPQSFCVSLTDCYAEVNYGDVLVYGAPVGGGGAFNWKGGAIIQQTGSGVETYVLNIPTSIIGPDDGNSNVSFSDLHIELRANNTHLYKNTGNGGFCTLGFERCNIVSSATVQKEYGETSGYSTTILRDCTFKEQGAGIPTGYHIISGGIGGAGSARRGKNAALRFLGACLLQPDFFQADPTLATTLGATKATKGIVWKDGRGLLEVDDGCSGAKLDASAQPRVTALACTVPGLVNDSYTMGRSGKSRMVNPFFSAVPSASIVGTTVEIPPFVTVVRAWMRLNGAGLVSGTNVRLNISNGDKSVLYGQNTAQPINTAGGHFLAVNIYLRISDDTISRQLTFWLDNGAGADANANVTTGQIVGGVEYV
jgi:hypothetical protein